MFVLGVGLLVDIIGIQIVCCYNQGDAMGKYLVTVTHEVEVEIDKTKFDNQFMQEFSDSFYNFGEFGELCDHIEHLGQLQACGIYDMSCGNPFIEGYGRAKDMGITARIIDTHKDSVPIMADDEPRWPICHSKPMMWLPDEQTYFCPCCKKRIAK